MKNAFSWEKINIYIRSAISVNNYLKNRNIYIFSLKKINTYDKISLYIGGKKMDIRQIETFVEVVRLESFSKAAEKLFITQPTVSNHITALEKEVGSELIDRSGRLFRITPTGQILYEHAEKIIDQINNAKYEIDAYDQGLQGKITILSSSIPREYILPDLIKSFLEEHPKISFSLQGSDSKEAIKRILTYENDFAIVGKMNDNPKLDFVKLVKDSSVLIVPNDKFENLENGDTVKFEDILDENFILREYGSASLETIINAIYQSSKDARKLRIVGTCDDNEAIKSLVSKGVGLSFMNEIAIERDIKENRFKYLKIKGVDFSRDFYFLYHREKPLSPLGKRFKDFVLDYVKNEMK